MSDFAAAIVAQARALSLIEGCAVLLAVLYLLLAIRENILCWIAAGISTAIYVYIFAVARLYMESALNAFYFGMAVYGWYSWSHGSGPARDLPVTRWGLRIHAVAILTIAAISAGSGFVLDRWSDAAFPYLDSLTTWSAIWTTFLVARKVLENWWYWLFIDSLSVFIYWSRDLELTALLFVIYLLMIPFGLRHWTKSYREAAA